MRRTYPTDLSDAEWSCLEPHLPTPKATRRPRVYPLREIIDAIFYVLRSGFSWRLLPPVCGYDPTDGKEVSPCSAVFGRILRDVRGHGFAPVRLGPGPTLSNNALSRVL
jgi:hypothetical protein